MWRPAIAWHSGREQGNLIGSMRILFGEVIAIGPGKVQLLEAVEEAGAISAAARRMGMSYRRASLLVDNTNLRFRKPLVVTAAGDET